MLNKKNDNDVVFIKQVPVHQQSTRLRTLFAVDEKVKFIKQVQVHPRDRLNKKTIDLIKQPPVQPRDRLKKSRKQAETSKK